VHDAEDLVQETYLRAWRGYAEFEGRSSVRTWLYRIATNVCLTALRDRPIRLLPTGLAAATTDPDADFPPVDPDVAWLEPMPTDPATIVASRDSVRLALIAGMQYLPPKQRAVLILREVLAFPAAEVAAMLDTSTAAVKSTLQRARARLAEVAPVHDEVVEPTEPQARAVLDRYMAAFEQSDAAAIQRLLREDAVLEMSPGSTWFAGNATCVPFMRKHALGVPGEWRMVPTAANGQPAALAYRFGEPFGVAVLTVSATHLVRITLFADPALLPHFTHLPG
jgi:RNA polymerase sigma-70 factor (ECF subfamily)